MKYYTTSCLIKECKYEELTKNYQLLFESIESINSELLAGMCDNAITVSQNLSLLAGIFSSLTLPTNLLESSIEIRRDKLFKHEKETNEKAKVTHVACMFRIMEEELVHTFTIFKSYLDSTEKVINVLQSLLKTYNQEKSFSESS